MQVWCFHSLFPQLIKSCWIKNWKEQILGLFFSNLDVSLDLLFFLTLLLSYSLLFENIVSIHVIINCNTVCWHANNVGSQIYNVSGTYLKLWVNWERKRKTSEVQYEQLMVGVIDWNKDNFTLIVEKYVHRYVLQALNFQAPVNRECSVLEEF